METINLTNYSGLKELDNNELLEFEGGGFWGDAAYLIAATAKCIYIFAKTATEYQASLPPNLKK